MVLVCAASFCASKQNTLVNGEKIHFFSFPADPKLREEWEKTCAANKSGTSIKSTRVICHLHFHKNSFESINKLKPDAIPFVRPKKRKATEESQSNEAQTKRALVSLPTENNEPKKNSENINIQNDCLNESKLQPYRLTIQIEKILQRPCPKSKKNNYSKTNGTIDKGLPDTAIKNENQYLCLVCKETFGSASKLHLHLIKHFTCDICGIEFSSQKSQKDHYSIHQSKNERYPYKCHVCSALFEKKDYIKTHNHIKNMGKFENTDENRVQYCKTCCMVFKDEVTFRKHLNSHVESAVSNHLNDPLGL